MLALRQEKRIQNTLLDLLVSALNPLLIMALVASLLFFLVDAFYQGEVLMEAGVRWIFFWFTLAIVLVSRIGLEQGSVYSISYGALLAVATWFYLMTTGFSVLWGLLFLGVVWWSAHRLVMDCTSFEAQTGSARAGRSVLYFSVAAVPVFGLGEWFTSSGLSWLAGYLVSAAFLLLTTSFLGMRRYLRDRSVRMPGQVALAWLSAGTAIVAGALTAAFLLPRPESQAMFEDTGVAPVADDSLLGEAWVGWSVLLVVILLGLTFFRRGLISLLNELRGLGSGRSSPPQAGSGGRGRPRSFQEFPNPFREGSAAGWSGEMLVAYTYEALDTWAGETGYPSGPDQTPIERMDFLASHHPGLGPFASSLGRLYSHVAYGGRLPRSGIPPLLLEQIWSSMTFLPEAGS